MLSNAGKFTSEGVITLRAQQKRKKGDLVNITIEVEDTGSGISREDIPLLFKAFSQTGIGVKMGGAGLGLALSMEYAKLMDGDITVKSKPGKGSCFTLNFDALAGEDLIIKEKDILRQVTGLKAGQGPFRVLIADDNEDNRVLLKELLIDVGFIIEEATDGNEAIEKYRSFNPHVILMDMVMPVLSGYEAIVQIKNIEGSEDIPIIAVTAIAFEEERDKVIKTGADWYLRKPFNDYELYECLKTFLGIEYVYEDNNIEPVSRGSDESQILSPESLKDLSDDMIDDLLQATVNLDQDLLIELLHRIKEKNPAITESLMKLVKSYQYDALIEMLEKRKGL